MLGNKEALTEEIIHQIPFLLYEKRDVMIIQIEIGNSSAIHEEIVVQLLVAVRTHRDETNTCGTVGP